MDEAAVDDVPAILTEEIPVVSRDAPSPQGELCPSCGSPVESSDKFCPACGTVRSVELPATTESEPVQKHFRCSNCGSEMAADLDQRSYVCPFCDSTVVVEFAPELTNRQRPEFIIGFAITREEAHKKFHDWLHNNSWFRPSDLSSQSVADKQKGVYLPFWSFSTLAESQWRAVIGEHWYRTETYTVRENGKTVTKTRRVQETEWWPLSGRHHRYYSGYLVSGSRGLPQKEAERIMPFNLPALKRYEPFFLAGWLSEEYSVDRDHALRLCLAEFQNREKSHVAAFLPGNTYRDLHVTSEFSETNSDLCLLPVYILTYRYRGQLFRFLVNGQTGKCDGDKPLSWMRIAVAIAVVVGVVVLVAVTIAMLNR